MLFVDAGNDKVGIGTNSPANKLSVVGGDFGTLLLDNGNVTHGTQLLFQHNGTANTGADIQMSDANGLRIRTLAVEHMSFHTSASAGSPAEYMRISTGGNIRMHQTGTDSPGLSNTTTGHAFRPDGIVALSSASGYLSVNRNGDGTIQQWNRSGNTKGSVTISSSGVIFGTTSDGRLKQDIEPLEATDKLMQINPVSYAWKENPDGPRSMGFIAQEMAEIMPEAVSTGNDDMMQMDYGRITPILVSALQDAHKKIEELESRIVAMESK